MTQATWFTDSKCFSTLNTKTLFSIKVILV